MITTRRRLARDIMVYGGGELALRSTGLLMLPVYTRVLAADEYGAWGFMTTAVGLLSALLVLGGDTAYARFFFEARTADERRKLASTWFLFLGSWMTVICLVLTAFARPLASWFLGHSSYSLALAFAILSTPLTVMNGLLGEVLRNEFRAGLYTTLNIIGALLLVASTLLFVVVLDKGLTGLAFGTVVALAMMIPPRVWAVRHHLRPTFSRDVLGGMLKFGVPLVPVSIAYWVFAVSDRMVLAKLSTLHELGLYTVAGSMIAGLALLQAALGRAFGPHMLLMYERDPTHASRSLGRLFIYIVAFMGIAAVAVSAFAQELLRVIATPSYAGSAVAVGPLALGAVLYASTLVTALPMSLTKRTKSLATVAWTAAILNLALNLALVPVWGMVASAWATAAAYFFLTGRYAQIGQRLWRIEYPLRPTIGITVTTVVFTAASTALHEITSLWTLLAKVAFVLAYLGSLLLFGVFHVDDLERVRRLLSRRRSEATA
jgi:O-antigen/teichoic acid export membrane protein